MRFTSRPATLLRVVLMGAALFSFDAFAQPPKVLDHAAHGLFTGEEWRFRRDNLVGGLFARIAADLVSIPSGAPWWSGGDWALFGTTVGSTIALSVGRPLLDVRFQDFVQNEVLGGPGHFTIWNRTGDLIIWPGTGLAVLTFLIVGLITGDAFSIETALLMGEAFAVAQLYHNMIKLLAGRAGPGQPDLGGEYFGPARGYKLWPAGTPSGHMASMYALLSVLMYSVDEPALYVGLNLFALAFGAALVGDNYHWLSDVTLGAAIGFCVGRWVVQHRSTHYVYGKDAPPVINVSVMPLILPGSGAGFGVVGAF